MDSFHFAEGESHSTDAVSDVITRSWSGELLCEPRSRARVTAASPSLDEIMSRRDGVTALLPSGRHKSYQVLKNKRGERSACGAPHEGCHLVGKRDTRRNRPRERLGASAGAAEAEMNEIRCDFSPGRHKNLQQRYCNDAADCMSERNVIRSLRAPAGCRAAVRAGGGRRS